MIVIWHCDISPPPSHRWPADLGVPVLVKTRNIKVSPYKTRNDKVSTVVKRTVKASAL